MRTFFIFLLICANLSKNFLLIIHSFFFFSHELQTCDWPRNVVCVSGKRNGEITEFTESLKNDDGDGQDHERVPRLLVEDVKFGQKNVPVSWTRIRLILVIYIDRCFENGKMGNGQNHERVPRLLVEDVNFGQKNVPVSWTRIRLISVI